MPATVQVLAHTGCSWDAFVGKVLRRFLTTDEIVDLLADIFRNFKKSNNLLGIILSTGIGDSSVLEALKMAQLSEQIVHLSVKISELVRYFHREYDRHPSRYAKYILRLEIYGDNFDLQQPGYMNGVTMEKIRGDLDDETMGYHVPSHRPCRISALSQYLSELQDIPILRVEGCEYWPRLRFCNDCNVIFVHNIATFTYPDLVNFTLSEMFVSSGGLRRFLHQHANTLSQVELSFVTLTDGSWIDVARKLSFVGDLKYLTLYDLFQKHPVKPLSVEDEPLAPQDMSVTGGVNIFRRAKALEFIDKLIEYFRTTH